MPTHLYVSAENIITPDDNWYVSVAANDNLPDMLIGRIPGNNPEMVRQIIHKIICFENSTNEAPDKVLSVYLRYYQHNMKLIKFI